MDMVINILIASVAFYIGGLLLSGVEMKSFVQCIIIALVVGVLDVTLGNFLKIVTLGIFSIGIFNWLLNAILIQVADWFLPGFKVKNFWWALGLAAVVSIASSILDKVI
ncbi:MAG: phage holin family protein [Saprospiraceae bacterium]|nr:phage holin family protein [Saprospiraceae bacterium]